MMGNVMIFRRHICKLPKNNIYFIKTPNQSMKNQTTTNDKKFL